MLLYRNLLTYFYKMFLFYEHTDDIYKSNEECLETFVLFANVFFDTLIHTLNFLFSSHFFLLYTLNKLFADNLNLSLKFFFSFGFISYQLQNVA